MLCFDCVEEVVSYIPKRNIGTFNHIGVISKELRKRIESGKSTCADHFEFFFRSLPKNFKSPKLYVRKLSIKKEVSLTDEILGRIFPNVRKLELHDCMITGAAFKNLSSLEILHISACSNLEKEEFKYLRHLKKLTLDRSHFFNPNPAVLLSKNDKRKKRSKTKKEVEEKFGSKEDLIQKTLDVKTGGRVTFEELKDSPLLSASLSGSILGYLQNLETLRIVGENFEDVSFSKLHQLRKLSVTWNMCITENVLNHFDGGMEEIEFVGCDSLKESKAWSNFHSKNKDTLKRVTIKNCGGMRNVHFIRSAFGLKSLKSLMEAMVKYDENVQSEDLKGKEQGKEDLKIGEKRRQKKRVVKKEESGIILKFDQPRVNGGCVVS